MASKAAAAKPAPAPAKAAPAPAKAAAPAASKEHKDDDTGAENNEANYHPEYTPNPPHLDGVGDMSQLTYLEEDNVVHNLICRYKKNEIYTNISNIMIAVNPYQQLAIYGAEAMAKYRNVKRQTRTTLPPHCYNVAEEAYQNLAKTAVNQSMVICGESGSGKTESAKVFMRYLAHATASGALKDVPETEKSAAGLAGIEEQFLQANPILEAFGNAQTTMNNNSSRFGKFTKVLFENEPAQGKQLPRPKIVGSYVETYLLEKSRVVFQERGERNYHIFYQLFRGLDEDKLEEWRLNDMSMFQYLSQTWKENTSADRVGLDQITEDLDHSRFETLKVAMANLGMDAAEQDRIFGAVAGVLHMGNVGFVDEDENTTDKCIVDPHPSSSTCLITAAQLMGVPMKDLNTRLTSRTIKVGTQTIVKPLKQDEAVENRDAVSKALYHGLFLYIVRKINKQLLSKVKVGLGWIGILDVFGFECSDYNNSFEQFCINYANERLQQYFNEHVIQSEQAEYMREALAWTPLQVPDNQDTIDLIEGRPNGIIAQLDSTCMMPKGTDVIFIDNVLNANKKHARIKMARERVVKQRGVKHVGARAITVPQMKAMAAQQGKNQQKEKFLGFAIAHYAGSVTYNSEGFLSKNADSTHPDTVKLFGASDNPIVKELLNPPAPSAEELSISNAGDDEKKAGAKGPQQGMSIGGFTSVGSMFSKQLNHLMRTLRSTQPHFVRCVNPNQFKEPSQFDPDYVRPQLRCGGLIEALRVLKLGYPSRCSYQSIYERFGHLYPGNLNQKDFSEAVFIAFGLERNAYQLGLTKVFFKPGKQEFLDQVLAQGNTIPPEMVKKIKSLMVRKRLVRAKAGVMLLVRFDRWIKHARSFRRIAVFCSMVSNVMTALAGPLLKIKQRRAAEAIQAHLRVFQAGRKGAARRGQAVTLQKWVRRVWRKRRLLRTLDQRVTDKKAKRNSAAKRVQKFLRRQNRRKRLRASITLRVQQTKERVARQQQLESAKRDAEEKARREKLEQERLRAEKESAERLKREEESRKKRELEEAEQKRKEEEERLARKKQEEEQRRKAEEDREKQKAAASERERREMEEADKRKVTDEADEARKRTEARERRRSIVEKAQQWQEIIEKRERERQEAEVLQRMREEQEQQQYIQQVEEQKAAKWAAQAQAAATAGSVTLPPLPPTPGLPALPPTPGGAPPLPADPSKPPPPSVPIPATVKKHNMDRRASLVRARQKQELEAELQFETKDQEQAFFRQVLLNGAKFLKYGRSGTPHIKYVCCNVLGNLFWDNSPIDPCRLEPCDTFIRLKDVTHVLKGKQSEVMKRKVAEHAPDWLCFSVVTPDRTVDLQAVNVKERELWVRAIESGVIDAKAGVVNFITGDTIARMMDAKQTKAPPPPVVAAAGGPGKLTPVPPNLPPPPGAAVVPPPLPGDEHVPPKLEGLVSPRGRDRAQSTAVTSREEVARAAQRATVLPGGPATVFSPLSDMYLTDEEAFLENGEQLVKYGRAGKPRKRWVNCTKDKLYWGDYPQPSTHALSSSIELAEVLRVRLGKVTEVMKRSVADHAPDDQCFSLILRDRTVDFQTSSRARRNQWVQALINTVQRAITEAELLMQNREKHRQMLLERRVLASATRGADPALAKPGSVDEDMPSRTPSGSISVSGSGTISGSGSTSSIKASDSDDAFFNQSRAAAPRSQTMAIPHGQLPPLPGMQVSGRPVPSRPAPPPPNQPPPLPGAPGALPPLPSAPAGVVSPRVEPAKLPPPPTPPK